jgi:hypothetical protein
MKQQSQAAIGRALGLSPASMSKLKGMGMPINSVESARAWRQCNIRPSVHMSAPHGMANQTPAKPIPSGAVANVQALMGIAASALAGGQCLDSMVAALRAALHAVPDRERGGLLLPANVMDVLVADVAALLPKAADPFHDGVQAVYSDNMDDEEAAYMGQFWYEVAAGNICPNAVRGSLG